MPQSLAKVALHIIFSTKERQPSLTKNLRDELFPYTATVINNLGCPAIEVGGEKDHLHILCLLSRTITIASLVEEIKKPTSKWMKTKAATLRAFHWQGGYAAFSVSESAIEDVRRYIQTQEEHHRTMTFEEELRLFFEKHKVQYDERYVWD